MCMYMNAIRISKRDYEFERPLEGRGIEGLVGRKESEKYNYNVTFLNNKHRIICMFQY